MNRPEAVSPKKVARVIRALPSWEPTAAQPVFSCSAIMQIARCGYYQAYLIKRELERQGLLPDPYAKGGNQ